MDNYALDYVQQKQQKRLNQIGRQLSLAESTLEKHALTQDKFIIVQTALSFLNLQTRWASAGPLARFLIMSQSALLGHQTEQSAAGFIGPHLEKVQQAAIQLMGGWVPPVLLGMKDLLATALTLISIGMTYVATQVLGHRKGMFPKEDPVAAQRAGLLFQELGLIFILGSGLINQFFQAIGEELKLDEQQQKIVQNIGLFYVCTLLIVLRDDEQLAENLQRFMGNSLDSIEKAIQKLQDQEIIEDRTMMQALSYLQLVRRSLDHKDTATLLEAIKETLQAFGIPYKGLKEDLNQLTRACAQLSQTFDNIFYQVEKTATTMDQAA